MKGAANSHRAIIASFAAIGAFAVGLALRASPTVGEADDEVVAPVVRAVMPAVSAPVLAGASSPPQARLGSEASFNPFGALNLGAPATLGQPSTPASAPRPKQVKQAAAPSPSAPPPAPAPVAPPLPFVAIGSLTGVDVTGGQPVAFLQQQDQLLLVRAGQPIGSTYRVESITAQKVEFTYLPLMQRQSLPLAP